MEGTRNEKVALVTVAYVIGFITAFIAFGISIPGKSTEVKINTTPHVASSVEQYFEEPTVSEKLYAATSVAEDDEGLYTLVDDQKRLLSIKAVNGEIDQPGFHYEITNAIISENGAYVFFCEELSPDAETCTPYVYETITETLHRVVLDGELFVSNVDTHTAVWNGNTLTVDGQSPAGEIGMPWELGIIAKQTEVEVQ